MFKVSPNMEEDNYGMFSLYEAIDQNKLKRFRSIINQEGFDVDCTDDKRRSVLMQLASIRNGYKFAKELLLKGASVHLTDKFGYNFLHLAARAKRTDNMEVGRLIIEKGVDVNCQDVFGMTPLYVACSEGNVKWIYLLLYYGASASISSHVGLIPLNVLSTKIDDYDMLTDILFHHTFDCHSPVSLSSLASSMCKDSSLFHKIVENISNVSCNEDNIDYFCNCFGDIKPELFKLFLEKFEDVAERLMIMIDLLTVVVEAVTTTNALEMYQIFNYLLYSKHVEKLIQNANFIISQYIDKFHSVDLEEEIQKSVFVMLSYGIDVTLKDLDTVYRHYGCCDLFRTLLHMDVISMEEQNVSSMVRLHHDPSLSVDDCCDDVLSMSDLLGYFNHPKLKELCLSICKDVQLVQKVVQMPQVPCLVELSRNVVRRYVVNRYQISTCKQFHCVLNGLPIDRVTRGIVAFERPIY